MPLARKPANQVTTPIQVAGLRVLVIGLGRFGGGVGVTRWLVSQGADVTVTDLADREQLADSVGQLGDLDMTWRLGGHDPADLDTTDLVVVNPAVHKAQSDLFRAVADRRIPYTTEMNLFCTLCPAPIIGVTGTYGKSTTCAMLAEALKAGRSEHGAGYTGVHLGGNIGRSLLTDLSDIRQTDYVILEMSNAQLEDLPMIRWTPELAVITNLSPHHLNRYPSYEAYVRAKLNVVGTPTHADRVIVGEIDAPAELLLRRVVPDHETRVTRVAEPRPPVALGILGEHNRTNAACVLTVCRPLGVDEAVVREALRSFRGLPHRLELVRTVDGVDYYNDSKATSPAATIKAVESFDRPIVAIAGGQRLSVPLADWAYALRCASRAIICTGESAPALAAALDAAARSEPLCRIHQADDLQEALQLARSDAQPGDVVLFSPSAPSFDRYPNFAARGRHFIDLVTAL